MRKKCFSNQEKLLKFEAEGQEFANFLRLLKVKAIETGMILSIMDMKKNLLCIFFIDLYPPR